MSISKKLQKLVLSGALLTAVPFALTGCSGDDNVSGNGGAAVGGVAVSGDPLASLDAILTQFPQYYDNDLPHVAGTTFNLGLSQPSPIAGLFGTSVFWTNADDNLIGGLIGTTSSLVSMNELMQFGNDGVVSYSLNKADQSVTFTMQRDVYWHDGTPLTLDDWVFAFELMAHPEYTGVRFSGNNRTIRGIMDFHEGNADTISGLVLSNNNRTLTIYFDVFAPTILYFGIHTSPVARHIFGDMPITEITSSPEALTNVIGWGPFILEHVVAGESVLLRRNENYAFGVPYIESLIVNRVSPELALSGMASGNFDYVSVSTAYFGDHQNPTNFRYIGVPGASYGYIAFRMGTWDAENNVNVSNPERLMNYLGAEFRAAMALAIDYDLLGQTIHNGLQFAAGSNIAPPHRAFIDNSVPGFGYNPARANEILDNAGFTQRDSEGFRLTPNGDPLTVIWASPTNPLEDILVPFHLQGWANIGIRVELWRGQTQDQNYLWDVLDFDTDNQEIHIYNGAWTVGAVPDPSGSWGHAMWNPSRHTSAEKDRIMEAITAYDTWDQANLLGALSDWQWYWYENVPYFPTTWSIGLFAINNRVANFDPRFYTGHQSGVIWSNIRLTSENMQ